MARGASSPGGKSKSRVVAFTLGSAGAGTARRLESLWPELEVERFSRPAVEAAWPEARLLVFLLASGIVLRTIAPLLRNKEEDPAVLLVTEDGASVVSLLGGHEAGANRAAEEAAAALGGRAVITTGTDRAGLSAIDLFAKEHGLLIENRSKLPAISSRHIEAGRLLVYIEETELIPRLPGDYRKVETTAEADVLITAREVPAGEGRLILRPRTLVLGIGLNSGTAEAEIEEAVGEFLKKHGYCRASLRLVATHEKKRAREEGLRLWAGNRGLPVSGFTTAELNAVEGVGESAAALSALGVRAVAEPAALLGAGSDELLVKKEKSGNLTLALAATQGRSITVVGTGPGALEHLTPAALSALRAAEVVVGYKPYLKPLEGIISGKEIISAGMTEEVARAKRALEEAEKGLRVAVVSGGDAGVYGMAGLVIEVAREMAPSVEVEVVPGISALNAAAAVLGAPLMHDFAAISLSDRLTPWEKIEARLEAAAGADFVICLYNPKSRGRQWQIERAREIILKHRDAETPVGIVRNALRGDYHDYDLVTLGDMLDCRIDMRTTVVIGNAVTRRSRGRMVTPRGYERKYDLGGGGGEGGQGGESE